MTERLGGALRAEQQIGTSRPQAACALRPATVVLHWAVAVGVIGVMTFGFWLSTLPSEPAKGPYVQMHKSCGMILFAVILARFAWRARAGFVALPVLRAGWERKTARVAQGLLLVASVVMPLSGIVRSLAYARPIDVFGAPFIPQLFAVKHEALSAVASAIHDCTAWVLVALIALHVCGAAKHHLVDRDDTLRRMTRVSPSKTLPS